MAAAWIAVLAPATAHATYQLRDDATGGDCTGIGTWDAPTKTCTIGQDLTFDASVESGIWVESHGLVVDGGGHTLTGVGPSIYFATWGVGWCDGLFGTFEPIVGVTVRNFVIDGFDIGVFMDRAEDAVIENNLIRNALWAPGIFVRSPASRILISGNRVTNSWQGVRIEGVTDSIVQDNVIEFTAGGMGILNGSNRNVVSGNDITPAPGYDDFAFLTSYSDDNVIHDNTFRAASRVVYLAGNRNALFHNNIIGGSSGAVYEWTEQSSGNVLSYDPPVGGNYWSILPCPDTNGDGFCDAPATFGTVTDAYPWTIADGWKHPRGTIVARAIYQNDSSIKVTATSALSAAAALEVVGYGPMTWDAVDANWIAHIRGVLLESVTVSGIEGSVTIPITAQ